MTIIQKGELMGDLISRQAAIEEVRKLAIALYGYDATSVISCAIYKLQNLPSAQPYTEAELQKMQELEQAELQKAYECGRASVQLENDWIPVTKKAHPDLPIRVQVQMDNGWIITAYYQEDEWLSVPDCDEPLEDEWIEAWRELPEPYKAERREK